MSDAQLHGGGHRLPMEQVMKLAYASSERQLANYLGKHWDGLGRPEANEHFEEQMDLPEHGFDRMRLAKHLARSQQQLHRFMADAKDGPQFMQACYDYIESEMNTLFFVENNSAYSRVARDSFEQFLIAAVAGLKAEGYLSAQEALECEMFMPYYDVNLQAYEHMRDQVAHFSGGATTSLVAFALEQYAFGKDAERIRALAQDPDVLDDDAKANEIVRYAIGAYDYILEETYGIQPSLEENTHPTVIWMAHHAAEICGLEFEEQLGQRRDRSQTKALHQAIGQRRIAIMNECQQVLEQDGDIPGILHCATNFEEMKAKAAQVPEYLPDLIDDAIENAMMHAHDCIPALEKHYNRAMAQREPVLSGTLHKRVIPQAPGHTDLQSVETIDKVLANALKEARSMRHMVRNMNDFAEKMAQETFYANMDPVVMLYAEQYMHAFSRVLAGELLESGHYRVEDFAALKQVEQKFHRLYDSAMLMPGMVREWTHGSFNDLFLKSYLKYASETGLDATALKERALMSEVSGYVARDFQRMLKDMDIARPGCNHPLMPLLATRAKELAIAEHGSPPPRAEDGADPNTIADYYEAVLPKAGEIMDELLAKLPKDDPYTGKKMRVQPFHAKDVAGLFTQLEQRQKMAGVERTTRQ